MPLSFTAIDFETANGSPASACSVGLVKVVEGNIVDRANWLIRPPRGYDDFSVGNVAIHGITLERVATEPTWAARVDDFLAFVADDWLVAHNAGFDVGVLKATHRALGLTVPNLDYLCSLQVARHTYHLDSYRLPTVALAAGFEDFSHHDALDDALACAHIMLHAARRHEVDTLFDLARVTRVTPRAIGAEAESRHRAQYGPMALG